MKLTRKDYGEYDLYTLTMRDCLLRAKISQETKHRYWLLQNVESMRNAHREMMRIYGKEGLRQLRQEASEYFEWWHW